MKKTLLLLAVLSGSYTVSAQLDSIFDQGVYRHFILHLPAGYSASTGSYPLVMNFHGLGSNASEQQFYAHMDPLADAEDFVVVYPDGIDNQWNLGQTAGPNDVAFAMALLDTIRERYDNIGQDCWYSTGMSMGGFLTYMIACTAPTPPTAIAVVTGNMPTLLQQMSVNVDPIPVLHFHGTNDATVPYNGSTGVSSVENTAVWWADENNCTTGPTTEAMPNISTTDNSTVEKISYTNGDNGSQVILYKVIGGGHTWPGAIDVPSLGVTNHDIDATAIMWEFFEGYCESVAGIADKAAGSLSVFPNPSSGMITVQAPENATLKHIIVRDLSGREIAVLSPNAAEASIDTALWASGMYQLSGTTANGAVFTTTIEKR